MLCKLECPVPYRDLLLGIIIVLFFISGEHFVLYICLTLSEALHEHEVELVLILDHLRNGFSILSANHTVSSNSR